jgi:hypothetical protein
MIRSGRQLAALTLAAVALVGCGGTVQERLGMGKRAPDEFQVVRRAPLVMPPNYDLRPPEPGAAPSQQQDPAAQAQALLTGQATSAVAGQQSTGELALVQRSPVQARPGIRETLVAENLDLVNLDQGRFLFILNFQKRARTLQEPVIDPVAESRRLAAAQGAGTVITMRTGSQPLAQ